MTDRAPSPARCTPALLEKLERDRIAALAANDGRGLEPLLASDLIYVHSTGRIESREALLAAIASGRAHYRSIEQSELSASVITADVGIVTSLMHIEVEIAGVRHSVRNRATAIWASRENGPWQLRAMHASPATADAAAPPVGRKT